MSIKQFGFRMLCCSKPSCDDQFVSRFDRLGIGGTDYSKLLSSVQHSDRLPEGGAGWVFVSGPVRSLPTRPWTDRFHVDWLERNLEVQ